MDTISLSKQNRLFWLGRYAERVYGTIRYGMQVYDNLIDGAQVDYQGFCRKMGIPCDYTSGEDFIRRYLFDGQTVFNQQALQPQHPGPGPEQYNAPGVEHIDQQRHPGPLPVPAPVCPQQQGEQEYHAHRQQQIHAVVALDIQPVEPQPLRRHAPQGEHKTQARQLLASELDPRRPQQQEQRGEEQAVAGVGAQAENDLIHPLQGRDLGHQAVVAVAPQADQVEQPRQGQPPGQPQPPELPGHNHPQNGHSEDQEEGQLQCGAD